MARTRTSDRLLPGSPDSLHTDPHTAIRAGQLRVEGALGQASVGVGWVSEGIRHHKP